MPKSRKEEKQKEPSLSPKDYKALLSKIELLDISQINSSSILIWEKVFLENNSDKTSKINITDSYSFRTENDFYLATAKWELKTNFEKEEDSFLEIKAVYNVILSKSSEVPKEFWSIYKKATLPLLVYPYFREFVQNISSRMNIPPLTLPLLFR